MVYLSRLTNFLSQSLMPRRSFQWKKNHNAIKVYGWYHFLCQILSEHAPFGWNKPACQLLRLLSYCRGFNCTLPPDRQYKKTDRNKNSLAGGTHMSCVYTCQFTGRKIRGRVKLNVRSDENTHFFVSSTNKHS